MPEPEFQLNAKDFHVGNMLADMAINKFVDIANHADFNKDGKHDISQYSPILCKVIPLFLMLLQHIDWAKVKQAILASAFIKSHNLDYFKSTYDLLEQNAGAVIELLPKDAPTK